LPEFPRKNVILRVIPFDDINERHKTSNNQDIPKKGEKNPFDKNDYGILFPVCEFVNLSH
jgi:hypothetical protein